MLREIQLKVRKRERAKVRPPVTLDKHLFEGSFMPCGIDLIASLIRTPLYQGTRHALCRCRKRGPTIFEFSRGFRFLKMRFLLSFSKLHRFVPGPTVVGMLDGCLLVEGKGVPCVRAPSE